MHRSVLAPVLLLAALPLAAQEKHTLAYKLQPGPATWSLQTQDMTQTMDMGGKPMASKMHISFWMEGKIVEVKDGVAAVDQRYARAKATSDMPGAKADYDSDVEGSKPGPMLRGVADLVGQTAKLRVDAHGKVLEATVPEDVAEQLERAGVNLKQGLDQALVVLPATPVAIGDTWDSEFDMAMGQLGAAKAKVTNKLEAVKGDVVTVSQKLTLDTAGMKLPPGMKLTVDKAEGTTTFDLRQPLPLDGTMTMDLKMGAAAGGVTMTVRSSTKRIEAPAPKAAPADAPKTGK